MATTFSATGEAGTRTGRRHLGVALLVIATAQLMVVLDATIVIVAQPHIQAALGFSGSGSPRTTWRRPRRWPTGWR